MMTRVTRVTMMTRVTMITSDANTENGNCDKLSKEGLGPTGEQTADKR